MACALDESDDKVLVWIDPASHVRWQSAVTVKKGSGRISSRVREWRTNVFEQHFSSGMVYNEADFIDIEKRISEVFALVFQFLEKVEQQLRRRRTASKNQKTSLPTKARTSTGDGSPPDQENRQA